MGSLALDLAQGVGSARRNIREQQRQDDLLQTQRNAELERIQLQGQIQRGLQESSQQAAQELERTRQQGRERIADKNFQNEKELLERRFSFQGSQADKDRALKKLFKNLTLKDLEDAREFEKKARLELKELELKFRGDDAERSRNFQAFIEQVRIESQFIKQKNEQDFRLGLIDREIFEKRRTQRLDTYVKLAGFSANSITAGKATTALIGSALGEADNLKKQDTQERKEKGFPVEEKPAANIKGSLGQLIATPEEEERDKEIVQVNKTQKELEAGIQRVPFEKRNEFFLSNGKIRPEKVEEVQQMGIEFLLNPPKRRRGRRR